MRLIILAMLIASAANATESYSREPGAMSPGDVVTTLVKGETVYKCQPMKMKANSRIEVKLKGGAAIREYVKSKELRIAGELPKKRGVK